MALIVRCYAILVLVVLSTTTVYASGENIDEQVREFAHEGYRDVRLLIEGPREIPLPFVDPGRSCIDLYQRRVTLMHQMHDYKPAYWDDPRNQAAVFLGTIWTPTFYFLGYSAISAHLDELSDTNPQAELDALSQASAQQRCFEK
jgi:hypothetical protein